MNFNALNVNALFFNGKKEDKDFGFIPARNFVLSQANFVLYLNSPFPHQQNINSKYGVVYTKNEHILYNESRIFGHDFRGKIIIFKLFGSRIGKPPTFTNEEYEEIKANTEILTWRGRYMGETFLLYN